MVNVTNDPDLTVLVSAAKSGDKYAFDRLIDRYGRTSFYHALSIVRDYEMAEDVVQEAFVQVIRMIGNLREPEKFESWLTSIVRNRALSGLRSRKRKPETPGGLDPELLADPATDDLDDDERLEGERRYLLAQMETLPEIQRRLLLFKYVERMSISDIAIRENLTEAAVRNHLYRARGIMRRMLEDERKRSAH